MQHKIFILLVSVVLCNSCANTVEKPNNKTSIECVSNFMQSIYRGKFAEANTIMVQDKANIDCLNKKKFNYNQILTKQQKQQYKSGAIIFNNTIQQADSIHLFELSDPISKQRIPTLKVVKRNKAWLVDFAYSCSGNL